MEEKLWSVYSYRKYLHYPWYRRSGISCIGHVAWPAYHKYIFASINLLSAMYNEDDGRKKAILQAYRMLGVCNQILLQRCGTGYWWGRLRARITFVAQLNGAYSGRRLALSCRLAAVGQLKIAKVCVCVCKAWWSLNWGRWRDWRPGRKTLVCIKRKCLILG